MAVADDLSDSVSSLIQAGTANIVGRLMPRPNTTPPPPPSFLPVRDNVTAAPVSQPTQTAAQVAAKFGVSPTWLYVAGGILAAFILVKLLR